MSFMIPFYSERAQISNLGLSGSQDMISNNLDEESLPLSDNETENIRDSPERPLSASEDIMSPATPESKASTSKSIKQQNVSMGLVLKNYFDKKQASKMIKKADHLQKFFDAMQETVRTFSPRLQIEIKSKISSLVSEYELKNLMMDQMSTENANNVSVQHQVYSNITSSVACSPLVSPTEPDNHASQWKEITIPSQKPLTPPPALRPGNENFNFYGQVSHYDTFDAPGTYRNF